MNNSTIMIQTGEKDDVTVNEDLDNQRYLVDMPNSYDVYWGFRSKEGQNQLARRVDQPNLARAVYEIPMENLATDEQIRLFNLKVSYARKTAREIAIERASMESTLSIDHAQAEKTVAFVYRAPTKGFAIGEILHAGKYFVAQSAGENADKVFIRIIHSTKLLDGKEEFANREAVIQDKFPVGSQKYLRYDNLGRITAQDYQPKSVATEAAPALTDDQRHAIRIFSERNGQAWKEKLNVSWISGSYKGLDSNQSALLQQIRNQFGPEWLASMNIDDLYPEAVQKANVAKTKAASQSR